MAMAMGGDNNELDMWWSDATREYEVFLDSEWNDPNQSELECINNYVKNLGRDNNAQAK